MISCTFISCNFDDVLTPGDDNQISNRQNTICMKGETFIQFVSQINVNVFWEVKYKLMDRKLYCMGDIRNIPLSF